MVPESQNLSDGLPVKLSISSRMAPIPKETLCVAYRPTGVCVCVQACTAILAALLLQTQLWTLSWSPS